MNTAEATPVFWPRPMRADTRDFCSRQNAPPSASKQGTEDTELSQPGGNPLAPWGNSPSQANVQRPEEAAV